MLDKLYAMAMRGNVAAAGLYLDRMLGAPWVAMDTGAHAMSRTDGSRDSGPAATAEPARKRLLSVAEAAEALGISKSMIYSLKRSGRVDVVRIGRRVLMRVEDLERLMGSRA